MTKEQFTLMEAQNVSLLPPVSRSESFCWLKVVENKCGCIPWPKIWLLDVLGIKMAHTGRFSPLYWRSGNSSMLLILLLKQEVWLKECLPFRMLGLWSVHYLSIRMLFSLINGLMSQSIEASNCVSCPLYHIKAVFSFSPPHPIVLGYKSDWKIKCGQISVFTETSY